MNDEFKTNSFIKYKNNESESRHSSYSNETFFKFHEFTLNRSLKRKEILIEMFEISMNYYSITNSTGKIYVVKVKKSLKDEVRKEWI